MSKIKNFDSFINEKVNWDQIGGIAEDSKNVNDFTKKCKKDNVLTDEKAEKLGGWSEVFKKAQLYI